VNFIYSVTHINFMILRVNSGLFIHMLRSGIIIIIIIGYFNILECSMLNHYFIKRMESRSSSFTRVYHP
jgi:hypothetical protein